MNLTKVIDTFSGNSLAIIAKLAVRKAAFPSASIIRIRKLIVMNGTWPSTLSKSPNRMAQVPVVKMPPLNRYFGPIRFNCQNKIQIIPTIVISYKSIISRRLYVDTRLV